MSGSFSTVAETVKRAASGAKGAVVSQHRRASEAGVEILKAGGNAVDAAIATAFALSVLEPWMSGLGGGGYMLIHKPGEAPALVDFNMKSPKAVRPADYPIVDGTGSDLFPWPLVRDEANTRGALSVCAPTMCWGMETAWDNFGSMPWADLIEPAIEFAGEGLAVDWYAQLILSSLAKDMHACETARSVFLEESGSSVATGWTARSQPRIVLGAIQDTLSQIARNGAAVIVEGDVAQAIVADVAASGGVLEMEDMLASAPRLREPAGCLYRGNQVWSAGSFSGGETLIKILRNLDEGSSSFALNYDFYGTLSKQVQKAIRERMASQGGYEARGAAASCTTHFCTTDSNGMTVSVTITLVSMFGSKVMSPQTGVMLNNGMSWFDPVPGRPNSIGPAKWCLNNMAPTQIQMTNGDVVCAGAAGGQKIIPALVQFIAFLVDCNLSLEHACRQPRLDILADGSLIVDDRLGEDVYSRLVPLGEIESVSLSVFPYHFGILSAIQRNAGEVTAVADLMMPWAEAVAE